jgi:hypothetical protein
MSCVWDPKEESPQKEVDRQNKEADDLDVARQISRKTFHPEFQS